MFDTYVQRHTTKYVDRNITVKEYKAPTDESVKLLNEMTEKALNNIVKTFSTSNNTLQAKVAVYQDHRMQVNEFMCKFTLNGKDHMLRVEINAYETPDIDSMVEKLYTKVCEKLAQELMQPFFQEIKKGFL